MDDELRTRLARTEADASALRREIAALRSEVQNITKSLRGENGVRVEFPVITLDAAALPQSGKGNYRQYYVIANGYPVIVLLDTEGR